MNTNKESRSNSENYLKLADEILENLEQIRQIEAIIKRKICQAKEKNDLEEYAKYVELYLKFRRRISRLHEIINEN